MAHVTGASFVGQTSTFGVVSETEQTTNVGEYFTHKTPEQTQTIRVGLVLASRRDAPAGLIQWGDDPSTTRYGLRSFQCFEAHSFLLGFSSFLNLEVALFAGIHGNQFVVGSS